MASALHRDQREEFPAQAPASLRNEPRITLLIILDPVSFTPRQCMQKWSASITTARPSGLHLVHQQVGHLGDRLLLDLRPRLMIHSARRAYLDKPDQVRMLVRHQADPHPPMIGQKWWLQALRTVIGPTIISSFRLVTWGTRSPAGPAGSGPGTPRSDTSWPRGARCPACCDRCRCRSPGFRRTPRIFVATSSSSSSSSSPGSMNPAMLSLAL